jgi:phosphate transport system permease protein
MTRQRQTRAHKTRWTVKAADRISAACISVGGVGTIVAVSAVFLFLVSVVVPLLRPGKATSEATVRAPEAGRLLATGSDEYSVAGWTFGDDGVLHVFRLDTGDTVATRTLVAADSMSAFSFDVGGASFGIGRTDGSVELGRIGFKTDFPAGDALPPAARGLAVGEVVAADGSVIQRMDEESYRRQTPAVTVDARTPAVVTGAVRLIDQVRGDSGYFVAAVGGADSVAVVRVDREENAFTGEVLLSVERGAIPAGPGSRPDHVLVAAAGSAVYVIDDAGHADVWNTRRLSTPSRLASADLAGHGARVVAVTPLIGRQTVIVGQSDGTVATWFTYVPETGPGAPAGGGPVTALGRSQHFKGHGDAVTTLAGSTRGRVFAVGYTGGRLRVLQATSGKRVLDLDLGDEAVAPVAFTPKNDGLIAMAGGTLHHFDIDLGYPEATLHAMFRPVWYEGFPEPVHAWQSSAGTDDFEPKLGMWPLVFGTLKATFYSMLFGAPLALLAAIYTSEFVSPTVRPRLKTLIESMASLPSVVLGFLAALVIAPFVQRTVPSVIVAFATIPGVLRAAGYAWQALPQTTARRLERFRLPIVLAALPIGIVLAGALGPWTERRLFGGDMMAWLAGGAGSSFGGWLLMLLPVSAIAVMLLMGRLTGRAIREFATRSSRGRVAMLDIARFAIGVAATLSIAALASVILDRLGIDARGGMIDTYVQRNALVVGFVMGFAIIPIIYTIAEDALSAVPGHLRAASLGAGATPWQTAIRIVLPTAMSGLFSAVMIGLGRAVGETMIVLMAAGNTPVLDMNIFNGFRTLSANIAVELPEAVRNSTHYRTLFFAALLLFLMTFVVNTVAEIVRLRFRRRSAQI